MLATVYVQRGVSLRANASPARALGTRSADKHMVCILTKPAVFVYAGMASHRVYAKLNLI